MLKKNGLIIQLILTGALSFSFACGGRLQPKPVTPSGNPSAAPSTPNTANPSALPSTDPSSGPKPPASSPVVGPTSGPSSNPGPTPTNPPPPDPEQPTTAPDFWNLMTRFGFTRTKEDMTNDIKAQLAKKITDWSPGTVGDKAKNIENHYQSAIKSKYFKVVPKDSQEYYSRSLTLANRKDAGINYYVDVTYGPKGGTINIQKVDAKTLEIVFFNKSALLTQYTQTDGSLLRLAHFMLIPAEVYSGKTVTTATTNSGNSW